MGNAIAKAIDEVLEVVGVQDDAGPGDDVKQVFADTGIATDQVANTGGKHDLLRDTCTNSNGSPDEEAWLNDMVSRRDIYPNVTDEEVMQYQQDRDPDSEVGQKWQKFKQACAGMRWMDQGSVSGSGAGIVPGAAVCSKGCRSCSKGCSGWPAGTKVKGNYAGLKGSDVSHCHSKCCPDTYALWKDSCPNGAYEEDGAEAACVAKCKDVDGFFGITNTGAMPMKGIWGLVAALIVLVIAIVVGLLYSMRTARVAQRVALSSSS